MTITDLLIQWTLFGMVVVALLFRRLLTPFHPTFYYVLFHLIVFCIRPTLVAFADFDTVFNYMGLQTDAELLRTTLWLSSFALVVFSVAFSAHAAGGTPWDSGEPPSVEPGQIKSFWLMALIIVPAGLYSVFGADVKGYHVGGTYVLTGTSGYLNDLQQVFVSFVVLFAFVHRWRWWSLTPLLVFIYYRLGEGHARWMMIYPVLFGILIYLWQNRRIVPPFWMIAPLPVLFIMFSTMTHDRWYFQRMFEGQETERSAVMDDHLSFKEKWDTMDFANFDYLAFAVAVVPEKTNGYNFGVQHLQLFTEPIPRGLWPGKPVGSPVSLIDASKHGNILGVTFSIVGDGWISYGWLGVTVTMAFYGFVLSLIYNWFLLRHSNLFKGLICLLVFSILVQVFRDGGIVSMARFLLFTSLPIILWWFFDALLPRDREHDESR